MSTEGAARENVLGWARLGLGALAFLVLPIWALISATIGQLFPSVRGYVYVEEGMMVEMTYPLGVQVFLAGASGALVLAVFGVLFMVVMLGWSAISGGQWLRGKAERQRLDELVAADAVLPADTWDTTVELRQRSLEEAPELHDS